MMKRTTERCGRLAGLLAALALPLSLAVHAPADVTFSHDTGTTGVPPAPPNAVFAAPDTADVFTSSPAICSAPGPNAGNVLFYANPASFGLVAGDNVDAMHITRPPLAGTVNIDRDILFSVDVSAAGLPGTAVAANVPTNAGDVYFTDGSGTNALCVNENQIGLDAVTSEDINGLVVEPAAGIPAGARVYFSLAPGSPSLGGLGVSPADILTVIAGSGGPPTVAFPAGAIGLAASDDVDGLIVLDGLDLNGDGDFSDFGEIFPMVVFSVSPSSTGLAGTAVALEVVTDPPDAAADIFISTGGGLNMLFMDEGAPGAGLALGDNIDALDLEQMATGQPPWEDGGPPPDPPPGCDVGQVSIGLCVNGSNGCAVITMSARLQCPPPMGQIATPPIVFKVPCNQVAPGINAIALALLSMRVPGGGPFIFQAPAGIMMVAPNRARVLVTVNPAIAPYKLVSIRLSWVGCVTMSQRLLPQFGGNIRGKLNNVFRVDPGIVQNPVDWLLEVNGFPLVAVPLFPGMTEIDTVDVIIEELNLQGFNAVPNAPNAFTILHDPAGERLDDVLLTGSADSGLGFGFNHSFSPPGLGQAPATTEIGLALLSLAILSIGTGLLIRRRLGRAFG